MKLRLLSLLLLISGVVHGQTPAGYIKANMRFKWTAGIFDSALHVPQYNGTPSGIRNGAWVGDGAVAVDTVNNLFYFRSSGAWHQTSSGAGWLLTGNSGTTSSNFIGTTDNQPLSFRVNNRWAGRIYTNGSVFIGDSSGVNNSALNNAGFGRYSLYNNTSGEGNTGSGVYSLYSNIDGSNNTGMGYTAGYNAKQKVDAKNQILIGANTYGTRDSIAVIGASFMKETIVRGKLIDSTLSAGAGTKAVRWNSSTGEFTYADTSEVTTPTWQQTLTAGSTLTVDNNINAGGNTFSLTNQYGMYIESTNGRSIVFDDEDGEPDEISIFQNVTGYNNSQIQLYDGTVNIRNLKDLRENEIFVTADSIWLRPSLGQLNIDSLRTWSGVADTTYKKPMTWDTRNGRWEYAANWYGGGGGSPAGSNKELQFNNSGSFGGTTGIKYGNATNERLSIWQQSSSDVPLTIRTAGDNSKAAIEIKDTTNQPYTSAIKFSPSPVGSPKASMIYQGYEGLYLDGGCAPYTTADGATVVIGNSTGNVAPFKVHSYPYDVPASPNNWVAKIRTSKTSAVGLAIDWGQAGQTGDLLQFRNNSAAVLASVTSAGNIKAPAPTYSSGGYKFLVRNSTSSQFESIDPLVGSSTYTPTTSGLTNVDSTHVFECQYSFG
jgi:hypothetical protein